MIFSLLDRPRRRRQRHSLLLQRLTASQADNALLFVSNIDVIRLRGPLSAQADDVGNRRFKLLVDYFQDFERLVYWLLVRSCLLRCANISKLRGHVALAVVGALIKLNFMLPPLD